MKKKAILLSLLMAALTGCGRVDSVDVDNITPHEIEKSTDGDDGEDSPEITLAINKPVTTTAASSPNNGETTTRSISVNLIKRTNVSKKTVASSRKTATNSIRPSNTTTKTTSNGTGTSTTGTGTGTTGLTTAVITTASVTDTTSSKVDPAYVSRDDMTCYISENTIEVTIKGEPVQNISIDTSYMLDAFANGMTDPENCVNICDLDFDGNFDLFIPQSKDEYNIYGQFLRFNPQTMLFEEWVAMSGITTYTSSSADDGTICSTVRKNDMEFEEKTYQWKIIDQETGEKELRLISKKKQFRFDDNPENQFNIYTDYYEYTDGVENVVKREKHLFDENGNFTGVEDVAIEWLT